MFKVPCLGEVPAWDPPMRDPSIVCVCVRRTTHRLKPGPASASSEFPDGRTLAVVAQLSEAFGSVGIRTLKVSVMSGRISVFQCAPQRFCAAEGVKPDPPLSGILGPSTPPRRAHCLCWPSPPEHEQAFGLSGSDGSGPPSKDMTRLLCLVQHKQCECACVASALLPLGVHVDVIWRGKTRSRFRLARCSANRMRQDMQGAVERMRQRMQDPGRSHLSAGPPSSAVADPSRRSLFCTYLPALGPRVDGARC